MGTWGPKTFENDGAADWLFDLEEAKHTDFLLKPLQAVARTKRTADIDDSLEGLAAAEVMAGARRDPPKQLPQEARRWIKRTAFVPSDEDLRLAIKAVEKIAHDSELGKQWKASRDDAAWQRELRKLTARLSAALRTKPPIRKQKPVVQRETLAELILAVAEGDESRQDELRQKLSKLSNPNRPVGGTWKGKKLNALTPLHWVASRGLILEAKLLLERGAEVDPNLPPMASPLAFAMERNHVSMVKLLLESGSNRQKALSDAIRDERLPVIRMILEMGVNLEEKTGVGRWTALMWAASCGARRSLELLLVEGAKVNCAHKNGDTPLHFAANGPDYYQYERDMGRFLTMTKLLVKHGARLNVAGDLGKTPLDIAEEAATHSRVGKQIATFLRQRGARNGKRPKQSA